MREDRIGFIGMGVMGAPMATNLAAAGWPVMVFDSDPAAAMIFLLTRRSGAARRTP